MTSQTKPHLDCHGNEIKNGDILGKDGIPCVKVYLENKQWIGAELKGFHDIDELDFFCPWQYEIMRNVNDQG